MYVLTPKYSCQNIYLDRPGGGLPAMYIATRSEHFMYVHHGLFFFFEIRIKYVNVCTIYIYPYLATYINTYIINYIFYSLV